MLTHIAQLLDPLGGDQLPATTALTMVTLKYAEAMAIGAERAGLFAPPVDQPERREMPRCTRTAPESLSRAGAAVHRES